MVVRTNGPKGTIFFIVPVSWLRTLVLGRSPSLTATVTSSGRMKRATLRTGFTGSDHFKDYISDSYAGMPLLIGFHNPFQYGVNTYKPGDILAVRAVKNILDRTNLRNPAIHNHPDPVREALALYHVVGGENDGGMKALVNSFDKIFDQLGIDRIKICGRFVQEKDFRRVTSARAIATRCISPRRA